MDWLDFTPDNDDKVPKRRVPRQSGEFPVFSLPLGPGIHIIVKFKDKSPDQTFSFKRGDHRGANKCWQEYMRNPKVLILDKKEV